MGMDEFEDDMIPHLREFSPNHWQSLDEQGLRDVVRLGMQRAGNYGVTNPGHLRLYVAIMLMYGSFFDNDPLMPWSEEVLRDSTIDNTQGRIDRLHQKMRWYYYEISGPHRLHDRQALRKCERALVQGYSINDPSFESKLVAAFFDIHARRAAYLGEERLRALVREAVAAAQRLEVATVDGVSMVAFLMFVKGHWFAQDPLVPWARAALVSEVAGEWDSRAKKLERAFYAYRERLCAPTE
jgi:hypothetical protein